jgi:hypothetical protein
MTLLEEIVSRINITTLEEKRDRIIQRQREYAATIRDKDAHARANVKYNKSLREEMIQAYGGCCVRCGETDCVVLVLDHINDDGKVKRTLHNGAQSEVRYLRKQGWPKGEHQLLCYNCNARKEYARRQTQWDSNV